MRRSGIVVSPQVARRYPQHEEERMARVWVGTCGFAESQARTFRDFDILEVQQSFYQPPRPETVQRWREKTPADFVFTLKAWQLITHTPSSPTYRRLREPLSARQLAQCGHFRWNPVTRMAWARTRELAHALGARAVLFQTLKRFTPEPENLARLYRFFESIEREPGLRLAFEPRGEAWDAALLRTIVRDLKLVHVVDPFLRRPVGRGLRYFRLHGRPAYHYRYRYTDADLQALMQRVRGSWPHWILFNNDHMREDALRLRSRISGRARGRG